MSSHDPVTRPRHYILNLPEGADTIDIIRALGLLPDFAYGNVIKYVLRYRDKNGIEDLRKARVYLDWLIECEAEKA